MHHPAWLLFHGLLRSNSLLHSHAATSPTESYLSPNLWFLSDKLKKSLKFVCKECFISVVFTKFLERWTFILFSTWDWARF